MKKVIITLIALGVMGSAHAAFNGVSHHSRANCANNESISWDWTKNWWFWVNSQHIDARTGSVIHILVSQWQFTWRNAMVHWGEGRGGWRVYGIHWMIDVRGNPIEMAREDVYDCSIYDGWWDKNK